MAQSATAKSETRQLKALVGVRLRPDEHAQASAVAQEAGISLPELLRDVLRQHLARTA